MEYPALQHSADVASGSNQRDFIRLNVVQLAILALIAFIAGWTPASPGYQRGAAIAVFVLMFIAFAVVTALRIGHFDDRWFRCRAFAENIKSAVWFFVMSAPGDKSNK